MRKHRDFMAIREALTHAEYIFMARMERGLTNPFTFCAGG